ncbi:MAG: aspartate-semialdehyde dehydrogenase [Candidatus Bathyarchaeia archaeon]
MSKLKAAVLGATGMVGQKFVQLLEGHPWFELTAVAASERSQSKIYSEAARWVLGGVIPPEAAELEVKPVTPEALKGVDMVFSALPADIASKVEEDFAREGFIVLSNASAHRMDVDVPLMNPEVNSDHAALLEEQRRRRKWDGAIVTNPNCTTAILTLSLKPIFDHFGISSLVVSTMQAISGAGYPGVVAMDIVDNIIPFIKEEEEKVERECLKILGSSGRAASFKVSASCHRVAVLDGHTEAVFVETERPIDPEDAATVMREFKGEPQRLRLPSAPEQPIVVRTEVDRPQPRLDRMAGKGMSVVVGRIRRNFCGVKYVVSGHNVIRGAAGCSILNAEILKAKGYL